MNTYYITITAPKKKISPILDTKKPTSLPDLQKGSQRAHSIEVWKRYFDKKEFLPNDPKKLVLLFEILKTEIDTIISEKIHIDKIVSFCHYCDKYSEEKRIIDNLNMFLGRYFSYPTKFTSIERVMYYNWLNLNNVLACIEQNLGIITPNLIDWMIKLVFSTEKKEYFGQKAKKLLIEACSLEISPCL